MWYQGIVPARVLLIPVLIMTTKGTHQPPKNDTNNSRPDVVVTYSNHAEASNYVPYKVLAVTEKTTDHTVSIPVPKYSTEKEIPVKGSSEVEEPLQDDVLFIPNDEEVVRNEEYLLHENLNIQDLMGGRQKTVADIVAGKDIKVHTESPNTDIIFVMGKNNENLEQPPKDKPNKKWSYEDNHYNIEVTTPTPRLNCSNLNCNNTIKSVCCGKIENNQWRYRLFMNECYFRKVNCNFRNTINNIAGVLVKCGNIYYAKVGVPEPVTLRAVCEITIMEGYRQVSLDNCKNIGAHSNKTVFSFKPAIKFDIKPVQVNNTRRSSPSSRRSLTMGIDGHFCSHPCPASCSEQYAPECAVSGTGRHRVFVNHCALDHNSCSFGIVWHRRPLSECVGGKKADMQQNSGFIGWMQRVGIVDKRGRLVLS